jgi:DNA-binding response OmpR family regulator
MNQVWLVDDDDEMSQAVALMLSLLKCKARIFSTSRQAAKALLAGGSPEMMFLDVNMPEVNGLALLEFIRHRPEWNKIPIYMLSAESTDTDVDKAIALGANGYLIKPVSYEELEHAVHLFLPKKVEEPR